MKNHHRDTDYQSWLQPTREDHRVPGGDATDTFCSSETVLPGDPPFIGKSQKEDRCEVSYTSTRQYDTDHVYRQCPGHSQDNLPDLCPSLTDLPVCHQLPAWVVARIVADRIAELVRYLRGTWKVSRHVAEDVAQDAAVYVLERIETLSFASSSKVRAYLYNAVRHHLMDHGRSACHRHHVGFVAQGVDAGSTAVQEETVLPEALPPWHGSHETTRTPEALTSARREAILVVSVGLPGLPERQRALLVTTIERHEAGEEPSEPTSGADRQSLYAGRRALNTRFGLERHARRAHSTLRPSSPRTPRVPCPSR